MSKNVKGIIIVIIILVIVATILYFVKPGIFKKSNLKKGYAKKKGEWVACGITDYDPDYYQGINTAGVTIYFKKSDVVTRTSKDDDLCASASGDMNIYTK